MADEKIAPKDDRRGEHAGVGVALLSGKTASSGGVFSAAAAYLNSPPIIIATLTAAFTISGIGMKDFSERAEEAANQGRERAAAHKADYDSALTKGLPGLGLPPESLVLARGANPDAFGDLKAAAAAQAAVAARVDGGVLSEVEDPEGGALGEPGARAEAAAENAIADEKASGKHPGLLKSRIGKTRTLARQGGMSSGIGRNFSKTTSGGAYRSKLRAIKNSKGNVRRKRAASRRRATSVRGAAAKRLAGMNRAMGKARRASTASAAAAHSRQWDAAGAGRSLQGAGASGNAVAGGGSGISGGAVGDGGPILSPSASPSNASQAAAPPVDKGKNVTPWQKYMDLVMILLPIAAMLLMAAYMMGQSTTLKPYAKIAAYIAMGVSAMVTALGVLIMTKGQALQGGMIAGVGGLLTFLSYTAAEGNSGAAAAGDKAEEVVAPQAREAAAKLGEGTARKPGWIERMWTALGF